MNLSWHIYGNALMDCNQKGICFSWNCRNSRELVGWEGKFLWTLEVRLSQVCDASRCQH